VIPKSDSHSLEEGPTTNEATPMACSISIVIPVFNRPDLLGEVLEGLVQQTYPLDMMEVLVCDDGSTEDLSGVLGTFKKLLPQLQHLRQPNQGPAAARNLGTRHARGKLVVFLDSDILLDSHLIAEFATAMEKHPEWVGVEARVEPILGEANVLWDAPVCEDGGVYLTAAIAYRKDALEQIGGFDESFKRAACEDVELAVRALKLGSIGFVAAAKVQHPRRRKTLRMYWNKRKDWRYLLYMAVRHGFVGWPGNRTRFPRMRLVWCALVTNPAGRLLSSLRFFCRSPRLGSIAIGHALFSWVCGLAAIPDLLFLPVPRQQNYLIAK
jgi:glycosyltransferase involved in cell wall biosynthesis